MVRILIVSVTGTLMVFATATPTRASVDSNGPHGIHSDILPLDGDGISIGQVEGERPGRFGFDDGAHSNFGTIPTAIFIQDDVAMPMANTDSEMLDPDDMEAHATHVAGVMISKDPSAPGVAVNADLYATAILPSVRPLVSIHDKTSVSTQFIATRANDDVRAINLSFNLFFESEEIGSGNSKYTEFIDWSAMQHDTLYVVAGYEADGGINFAAPTDNYNGMTVGASTRVGDFYSRVANFNDFTYDAQGPRTSIAILAPGDTIEIAERGGPSPAPTESGTSIAAPHVTGTVAILQQHAENKIMTPGAPQWTENARRHEVMKAVLLNSADKIQGVLGMERTVLKKDGISTWANSDADMDDEIPLDMEMGAGHLNAKRAYQQFDPGEYAAGGAAVPAIGWDYGTTDGFGDIQKYVLAQALPANQFVSLTLAWDREVFFEIDDGDPGVFDIGDQFLNDSMPIDLNLYLMPVGETDLELAAAKSIASDTSVEHIFQQVPAGMYEIWVEQASGTEFGQQNYALAWMTATLPDLTFGDYSGNGTVGPEDYSVWKSNFGSTTQLAADGNGNGIVDAADYTIWRDNLGASSGSATAVPEAGAWWLLWTAMACTLIRRGGRQY